MALPVTANTESKKDLHMYELHGVCHFLLSPCNTVPPLMALPVSSSHKSAILHNKHIQNLVSTVCDYGDCDILCT